MAGGRPSDRVSFYEVLFFRCIGPDFAGSARDKVIDPAGLGVLKVVFVSAEHDTNAGIFEPGQEHVHFRRVSMRGTGAERRVMRKNNAPGRYGISVRGA